MKQIHDFLKSHQLKSNRYQKCGKVYIVEIEGNEYAIKKKETDKTDIYRYLESRNFTYYPEILTKEEEDYEVTKVIHDLEYPLEQKIIDLIDLIALLHSKTTFFKEVDKDYYEKIYEDISGNIEYLEEYYTDIITMIEKEVYMSPSFYLFARNVNLIFSSLYYAKDSLNHWHELVSEKTKTRFVVLHNNLKMEHFLKEDKPYFISWDQSKIDLPIFDLYKLYKNHALEFDFDLLLKEYEKKYPLLEEERILLFVLIAMPNKLNWMDEYETCEAFAKEIDLLYKTQTWLASYGKEQK